MYALHWCLSWRARLYLGHLPTFSQLPLLGSMHLMFGGGKVAFRRFKQLSEISEETNKPFILWVGPRALIFLNDPEEMKIVSNTFVEKPSYYDFGKVWLGDGLVLAPGDIWKQNIRKIGGTFIRSIVNGYQDIFNAQARKLVEQLKMEVNGLPFNARDYISHVTLETICQTGFGVSQITDNLVTEKYHKAFHRATELIVLRGTNIFYHPDWVFHRTSAYKELMECVGIIHNVSETVIKKRKFEREALKSDKSLNRDNFGKPIFRAFLDILLDLSEIDSTLTDQQIRSEVDTIIVGAQESVATALLIVLLMIGNNSDVQTKLYTEIKQIMGDNKRHVDINDLKLMEYCEAVIMESMRLFPAFPSLMRQVDCDFKLKSCTIPKDTTCIFNIWGAGRSQRLWGPDADQFVPERWLPPRVPYITFGLAFSIGKRACIGKTYAINLLKTVLAHCVRELTFTSEANNLSFKFDLVLRPISGHLMQVKLRKDSQFDDQ
ncbi:unnamed protein product, partial [Brenthis ino]